MQREARFGDRVVPAFCERPRSIWAMVADAVSRNPDGEALVCGDQRMTWREVAQQSARIAAGMRKWACKPATALRCCSATASNSCLRCLPPRMLGLVTVLLSTRQQKPEIAYMLNDCGAKLLIHEAALAERLPGRG